MSKVAVCVDGSPSSNRAWRWALQHIIKPESKVTLVSVAPAVNLAAASLQPPMVSGAAIQAILDANKAETETLQATLIGMARESKHTDVEYTILSPTHGPGQDIVDYVDKEKFDHVIIGSRGLGAFKRSFFSLVGLGSVSQYVMNHCHHPVTIVRPSEEESK